ncbi:MAG: hypothetical protein KAS62_07345, partial [Candidatus Delongbacteria bacterium]|nr:hypothetical protein [Candidatus Delongbacteria bacterium]
FTSIDLPSLYKEVNIVEKGYLVKGKAYKNKIQDGQLSADLFFMFFSVGLSPCAQPLSRFGEGI